MTGNGGHPDVYDDPVIKAWTARWSPAGPARPEVSPPPVLPPAPPCEEGWSVSQGYGNRQVEVETKTLGACLNIAGVGSILCSSYNNLKYILFH